MIKRTVLIAVLCLGICNFAAFAQAPPLCDDSMVMAIKGKWKTPHSSLRPPRELVTTEQYRQITNRIDGVHPLLLEAYPDLVGMEARWTRDGPISSSYSAGILEYSYRAMFFYYFCSLDARPGSPAALEGAPFKPVLNEESSTYFVVNFNGGFLLGNSNTNITVNGLQVFPLKRPTETWKGYNLYRRRDEVLHGGRVLLTRKGMSPYRPITRKQYIDYMIATVHRRFDNIIAAAKKTLQMPEDPFGLKEGAKQVIADAAKAWESISARFQEELKENEADKTLDSPAIVDGIEKTRFFENPNVFTTEEKGGQALVTVNPDYFRKDLPPFVAQLIVVDWVCSLNTPTEYYRKRVEANLPIEKFQAMIDR